MTSHILINQRVILFHTLNYNRLINLNLMNKYKDIFAVYDNNPFVLWEENQV
jgi:hypothetical protein